MQETRKEGINIVYNDDRISIIGDSFKIEGGLTVAELTKIYMGQKGRTVATLTLQVKDTKLEDEPEIKVEAQTVKKITINDLIDQLAAKGLTEDEIMKTEVTV